MAQTIQCKAAIAWGPKQALSIETVSVDPPKENEVRVKILFTSVCHTDEYTLSGLDREAKFPLILGHEAAGIVESIGDGVTSVQPGDHVIPLYIPQCRECKFCNHPMTNLCQKIRSTQGQGLMPDGTTRFKCKDQPVYHYMGTSTFSEYTVVAEISLAKVDPKAPLDRVCLLGCGVSTGYGAALNTANIQQGNTVAVFGLGAVGLAVAFGCKARGASRVIGVDINDGKREIAKSLGVTDFINPKSHNKPIQEVLVEMTDGGLDFTFECVGNVKVMQAALESCHRGWGKSIIIGVAAAGEEVRATPFLLITGRSWTGSAFGGWKSRDSTPKLVEQFQEGVLPVDKFITHRREGLDSLNEVFELLRSGQSLRCVISY